MQAISKGHDDFGSASRQHDLDVVSDPEFKSILKKNNVILIGWKEIRDLMVGKQQTTPKLQELQYL
jgi:hypothetical protein